ncbi:hypothetical protein ACFX1Z_022857 [Malus domestica]
MGVILKCIFSSLPSTRPFGSSLASGSVGILKLSKKKARALPRWVTHWEVARKFQKQNREGVVEAQSRQYHATVVVRTREVVRHGPGCDIAMPIGEKCYVVVLDYLKVLLWVIVVG